MTVILKQWSGIRFFLVASLLFIAGCATQLAPSYDKNVVDGLNSVNVEVMTLMAAVSQGTNKNTFSSREEKYNPLIGKLDALALSAGARPMPVNNVTDAINNFLEERGGQPIIDDGSTPPSAHAIKKIAESLAKMKDVDKKQGLTMYEVKAFKGQVVIYFDQAITYENFLQR
ncbi:hypothetical protein [Aeromonas salmonicida]|uniref:hypothetical protein n=1 Tax=Aeromonas salmonicida TaxID=645 RepID=UPI003D1FF1F7